MTQGEWSNRVKSRDGNKCVLCGSSDKLNAHHIKPVVLYPECKYDIDNGITLCRSCHRTAHGGVNWHQRRDINGIQADPEGREQKHREEIEAARAERNEKRKATDCAWRSTFENGPIIIQAAKAAGQTPNEYITEAISRRLTAEGYSSIL